MQIKNIIIDLDAIESYLRTEDSLNSERTHTFLDLLMLNTCGPLSRFVNRDKNLKRSILISMDFKNEVITILGETINSAQFDEPLDVFAFMKDKSFDHQIFWLFDEAIEYSRRINKYNSFFKEIDNTICSDLEVNESNILVFGDLVDSNNKLEVKYSERNHYLVVGPVGSGKTVFINQMIQNSIKLGNNNIFYNIFNSSLTEYSKLINEPGIKIYRTLKDLEMFLNALINTKDNPGDNGVMIIIDNLDEFNYIEKIENSNLSRLVFKALELSIKTKTSFFVLLQDKNSDIYSNDILNYIKNEISIEKRGNAILKYFKKRSFSPAQHLFFNFRNV